jgi:hypothetical protein
MKFHQFFLLSFLITAGGHAQETAVAPLLETRVYEVSSQFEAEVANRLPESGGSPAAIDPFADEEPVKPAKNDAGRTLQEYFEELGVTFGEGASVSFDSESGRLTHTNSPGEIAHGEQLLESFREDGERQITIYYEMIEVDHAKFSDWLFSNVMDSDGTPLRNEVQKWIKAGEGEIIETATVVARSGQRAKVESIDEFIYPTEYNSPVVSNKVTLSDGAVGPVTAASPTAFETRNLGTTLEVDPVLSSSLNLIDLNLAPENVRLEKIDHWHHRAVDPRFKAHTPVFYTMKITTQVVARDGGYAFLGTTRPLEPADPERRNPIVLNFVRGDVGSTRYWREVEQTPGGE